MAYFTPARAVACLATTSIAALMVSSALAQTPPAAPKPATPARPAAGAPAKPPAAAQPAPQAQPGQPGQQAEPSSAPMPQLIYSQWLKLCVLPDGTTPDPKDASVKGKQMCYTSIEGRMESGVPIVAVVAIDPPGDAKKVLRVQLTAGVALQQGTRLVVDSAQALAAPYATCFQNACIADYELTADTLGKLKKGKTVDVQWFMYNGSFISVPVQITEFAKAFDGAPSDPKVLEQQQKKLEDELKKKGEELQKKANEARQKLEQGGGAAKPQ